MNLDDLSNNIVNAVNEHGIAQVAMKLCESLSAMSDVEGKIHHEGKLGQVKVTPKRLAKIGAVPSKDSIDKLSTYHIGVFKVFLGKYVEKLNNIKGEKLTETDRDQLLVPLRNMDQEITKMLSVIER